jgi:hypothetical protein
MSGEGVLMRRLRATTETNALGFLSLPPLALTAAAAAVQLPAVVGAGCCGLERTSTDGGAQCAETAESQTSNSITETADYYVSRVEINNFFKK